MAASAVAVGDRKEGGMTRQHRRAHLLIWLLLPAALATFLLRALTP
jgi:hypothetical protein